MFVFRRTNVCVSRVHICVFTCVPIGHVLAFQENTRLFSDEHTGAGAHLCECSRVHLFYMCVHVYTYVCSTCTHMYVPLGHVFVFQVDTLPCAR